jgi:hypothetical protein
MYATSERPIIPYFISPAFASLSYVPHFKIITSMCMTHISFCKHVHSSAGHDHGLPHCFHAVCQPVVCMFIDLSLLTFCLPCMTFTSSSSLMAFTCGAGFVLISVCLPCLTVVV